MFLDRMLAEQETKLFEFELFYFVMIPDKEKKEVTRWVKQKRKKDWGVALGEADGDLKKSYGIFCGMI